MSHKMGAVVDQTVLFGEGRDEHAGQWVSFSCGVIFIWRITRVPSAI